MTMRQQAMWELVLEVAVEEQRVERDGQGGEGAQGFSRLTRA